MSAGKLKEIVSYFIPLQIEVCSSIHNPVLEVRLSNGRYILNAANSNYSFGALYTIFKKTFDDLVIKNKNINSCLLLGLGGGSVVHLLRKRHQMLMPITAVEIDPAVIELGQKYFGLNSYENFNIVNEDAFDFSKNCSDTFDLIIIDLYINDEVPGKFHTKEFIFYLKQMSHPSTIILFNKMLNSKAAKQDYSNLVKDMSETFGSVSLLTYNVNEVANKIICVNTGRVYEKPGQPVNINFDIPYNYLKPKLN